MFEKNPFWDTMWSKRDEEFLWSGIRGGFCIGGILATCLCIGGCLLYNEIKEKNKKRS